MIQSFVGPFSAHIQCLFVITLSWAEQRNRLGSFKEIHTVDSEYVGELNKVDLDKQCSNKLF